MKKVLPDYLFSFNKAGLKKISLLLLFSVLTLTIYAQATGDFRSRAAVNGNWSDTASWEIWTGTAWVDSTLVPGDSSNVNVLIQDGTVIHVKKTPAKAIDSLNVGQTTGGILIFDTNNVNITVNGATTINSGGMLSITSTTTGARSFNDVTINSSATWSDSGNSNITIKGNMTDNGTFISGTGNYTFSGTAKSITGPITFARLNVIGTCTNVNEINVTTALLGSGTLTQAANALLTLGGTSTITNLNASTNTPNKVIYNGTVTQTANLTTYYDLEVASNVSLGASVTSVLDMIKIDSLKTLTFNTGTLALRGVLVNNGTINATNTSATIIFQGTVAQTLNGTLTSGQLSNITVNNASGVAIAYAIQINRGITLTVGNLSASGTITLGSAGVNSFSYVRANGNITTAFVTNYGTGANNFTYSGTTAAQVIGAEMPVTATTLTINDSLGVTLNSSLSVTTLNLTSGILNSASNLVSVTGTATTNVTGGGINAYVKGKLSRALPASVAFGSIYTFPIGKSAYQLFELMSPVISTSGVLTVEVFDGNTGGTPGFALTAINTNRYWSAIPNPSNVLASASIRLTEGTPGSANTIGQSAAIAGTYINKGGTFVGQTVLSGAVTSTLGYFLLATAGTLNSGVYPVGDASTLTKLCNVAGILNTITVSGDVTFEMQSDYDGTTGEIFPITFNQVTTSGGNWTVTIRPAAGVSVRTTSGDPGSGNSLITFNGGDRITIDGRAGGTGSAIGWVFRNIRTTATVGPTFNFLNDAVGNTLTYLQIEGQNIGGTSGTILFGTTIETTGNDSNTVSNSSIRDRSDTTGVNAPANAVYAHGTANADNDNITVTNNNIFNFSNNGVNAAVTSSSGGSGNWTVTNNSFYSYLGPSTGQTAINLVQGNYPGNGGNVITGNYIGGSAPLCVGNPFTNYGNFAFNGIYLTVDTASPTSVQNNTIQNIDLKGGGISSFTGISVIGGSVNIGNIAGNLISSVTVEGTNGSTGIYISPATTAAVENVSNNTIANIDVTGVSTSETNAGIWADAGINTITNNTVFNLSSESGNIGTGSNSAVVGISVSSVTPNQTISQNSVHSLSNTHITAAVQITGINFSGAGSGTNVISKNIVHSFSTLTTSLTARHVGINAAQGIATYSNNMISLGFDANGAAQTVTPIIMGITKASTNNMIFYYNSVYIGGSGVGTGAANTYAFKRTASGTTGDIVVDNVFMNARSNATTGGKHYAISLDATTKLTSDYNVLYVTGTGGLLGNVATGDFATFTSWESTNLIDINSVNGDPAFKMPDGDSASTDLHIKTGVPSAVAGMGTPVSITTDIDGDLRDLSHPDIGADEGNFIPLGTEQFMVYGLQFTVYPNPASNFVTIAANLKAEGGNVKLTICNILGEIIFNKQLQISNFKLQTNVDVSGFAKGIYMITLKAEDGAKQVSQLSVE